MVTPLEYFRIFGPPGVSVLARLLVNYEPDETAHRDELRQTWSWFLAGLMSQSARMIAAIGPTAMIKLSV